MTQKLHHGGSTILQLNNKNHHHPSNKKAKKVSLFGLLSSLVGLALSLLMLVNHIHLQSTTTTSSRTTMTTVPDRSIPTTRFQRQPLLSQSQLSLQDENVVLKQQVDKLKQQLLVVQQQRQQQQQQQQLRKEQQQHYQGDYDEDEDELSLLQPKQIKQYSAFAQITKPKPEIEPKPEPAVIQPLQEPPPPPNEPEEERDEEQDEDASSKWEQAQRDALLLNNGATTRRTTNSTIYYLNHTQVSLQDTFSASWIQRTSDFLQMPLERVMICEDAAWKAWEDRPQQLRMTLDYMDFSVEHLSKWWKFLTFFKTPVAYQTITTVLLNYIQRNTATSSGSSRRKNDHPTTTISIREQHQQQPQHQHLARTICVIAFQPYLGKHAPDKHYNLTVLSLAATIESIRRARMGRVVVVGLVDNGPTIAQESFDYLAKNLVARGDTNVTITKDRKGMVTKIGHLQVAYAHGSAEIARSKHLKKNIPRAVLFGLKQAFQLAAQQQPASQRTVEDAAYITEWLGDEEDQHHHKHYDDDQHSNDNNPYYWKYVYLTEPDTLLNIRHSSIPDLTAQLDAGYILAPHRLQPIPHESDLPGLANKFRYLNIADGFPVDDIVVWEIDPHSDHDVCCDEHAGPTAKPGKTNYPDCGTWWYTCGFGKDFVKQRTELGVDVHERLRPYQFMKLKPGIAGTGLTLLSGNLFGRRCFPGKHKVCKPPY